MTLIELWTASALLILTLHLLPALLIDRRLALGTWTRLGLTLFVLLGPIGLLCELWLLSAVLADVVDQRHASGTRRTGKPVPSPRQTRPVPAGWTCGARRSP